MTINTGIVVADLVERDIPEVVQHDRSFRSWAMVVFDMVASWTVEAGRVAAEQTGLRWQLFEEMVG